MAEHKHGTMDITTQEKVFAGFMSFCMRATGVILVLVVLLALFRT
ncbi:MAG: aa3-type cytochrome c oxidase subunit IV [Paracoccaceae bacterium]